MKLLPTGIENFKELIDNNYYYVDKSDFISDVLNEKVVLYTRPRRFGKTLNMSMLYYFFSCHEKQNSYLFDGLNISSDSAAMIYQNRYPVIYISFKDMKNSTLSLQIDKFRSIISRLVIDQFNILFDSEYLDKVEKDQLYRYKTKNSDESELRDSLYNISTYLYKHYHEKTIILIDEYDVPLQASYQNSYYDKMIDFMRIVFSSALKTNDALEKAVMTGCLRISKESIFTGLNNFTTYSLLDNISNEYFGFTENEVKELLGSYNLQNSFTEVKEWYDGYQFGNSEIYNPWSTLNYVKNKMADSAFKPVPFWANTSGNELVVRYIRTGDKGLKNEFEKLMNGQTVKKVIQPELTYREMENINNIYSFLLLTGYLKAVKKTEDNMYELIIPNKEVYEIYRLSFMNYFNDYTNARKSLLYQELVEGNTRQVNEILNDILMKTISYYDNSESFYHGFLAGLLNDYQIKSNREAGNGRFDLCIVPDSILETAVIIECKHSDSVSLLRVDAEKGAEQINNSQYRKEMINDGYSDVIGYGISFNKKQCYVVKCRTNDLNLDGV